MDLKKLSEAGYVPLWSGYVGWIKALEWDDDYDLVQAGTPEIEGDEYLSTIDNSWRTSPHSPGVIVRANDAIFRRLKPGLVKVKVKEE